ncbi:hypothetical protein XI09_30255 [Bradyrhizobium sp. CCBAU 11386]|nr:hypothetical protein [Bradyrhizobium sp. CCBAU 11386]
MMQDRTRTAPRRARLLVLGGVYPFEHGSQEAANVVSHQLIRFLAESGDFEVAFACVAFEERLPPAWAGDDLEALARVGVALLPPIRLHEPSRRGLAIRFLRLLRGDPALIRGYGHPDALAAVQQAFKPDALLTIWSEIATALTSDVDLPKFAYYGNPEHKILDARLRLTWANSEASLGGRLAASPPVRSLLVSAVRRAHLKLMARQDWIGDVAMNDAEYYRSCGLVQAEYIRNMWVPPVRSYHEIRTSTEQTQPFKILGNVGHLGATGNTHGLATIAREILPHLKRRLGEGTFEIHLCGGGSPHPLVAPLLDDPHLKVRGFVDDLEEEMRTAPVFLVANNSSHFVVGHTRFLHAWSLGCCAVGFAESRLAMPELEHGRNVLLGDNAEQVVEHIVTCARQPEVRRRIGTQALEDLRTLFGASVAGSQVRQRVLARLKLDRPESAKETAA